MATAKQIAARKKFVAAVRAGKFKQRGKSNTKADKKRKAKPPGKRTVKHGRKKTVYYEYRKNRSDKPGTLTGVKKKKSVRKRSSATIASLKSRIRGKLEDQLKELLFRRDKATTAKQHRSAQKKITQVRRDLKKVS